MHGKLHKYLEKDHVDQEMSFQWMKYTGLKGETEGLITAAQDQALNTRYYSKHIIKQGSTDRCRLCHCNRVKDSNTGKYSYSYSPAILIYNDIIFTKFLLQSIAINYFNR